MILVDTSVWVDHLRRGNARLAELLVRDEVACHPFVMGELSLGALRHPQRVLEHVRALPQFPVAEHAEVSRLVEERKLAGSVVGWVDAHLLAATLIGAGRLWSLDKPLVRQAVRLGVAVKA
ncbi:MAG: PIN domain-containing protein [Gemmatimonadales bacterium]